MLGERNKKPASSFRRRVFVLRAMENFLKTRKPTYEELEQRVEEFENETARRGRTEESLRESKERYLTLVETIPHGIQEIDTSGVITFANDAYRRLMGYEEEEILGKAIWELIEFETASGKAELQEYLKLLVRDQPSPTPYFQKNRKKNGELIEVQVDWNYKRNEQGLVTGFISVLLTDITEKKRAEKALKRAYAELERKVEERTADLVKANEELHLEIAERKRAEVALREAKKLLEKTFASLGEAVFVVDQTHTILACNTAGERIFGYTEGEMVGRNGEFLHVNRSMSEDFGRELFPALDREGVYRTEFQMRRKNGNIFLTDHTVTEIVDDSGHRTGMVSVVRDITDRVQAEEQIQASLREKEVLLKEIYHRVKNNVQAISSLLKIQSDKIQDKEYADMFKDSLGRIRSMGLVQEKLKRCKDFANVDFNGYVKTLVNGLFRSQGIDTNKIKAKIEIKDVSLGIDTAVPCGLLINELVSNSLKHAFPEERNGEIRISLRSINEDEFELRISDDGVGIPENLDFRNTKSLGLELVMILAEDQLKGKVELDRTTGTRYQIRLKRQKYRPRI